MGLLNQSNGFIEIPHSADLALQVWADSLAGLFIQAAKGMYSFLRIDYQKSDQISRKMDIQEIDLENLLVSFLNELLVDLQQNKKIYNQFHLEINCHTLIGDLTGKEISNVSPEIKAATYHDLKIIKTKSDYQTTIVFDI